MRATYTCSEDLCVCVCLSPCCTPHLIFFARSWENASLPQSLSLSLLFSPLYIQQFDSTQINSVSAVYIYLYTVDIYTRKIYKKQECRSSVNTFETGSLLEIDIYPAVLYRSPCTRYVVHSILQLDYINVPHKYWILCASSARRKGGIRNTPNRKFLALKLDYVVYECWQSVGLLASPDQPVFILFNFFVNKNSYI